VRDEVQISLLKLNAIEAAHLNLNRAKSVSQKRYETVLVPYEMVMTN